MWTLFLVIFFANFTTPLACRSGFRFSEIPKFKIPETPEFYMPGMKYGNELSSKSLAIPDFPNLNQKYLPSNYFELQDFSSSWARDLERNLDMYRQPQLPIPAGIDYGLKVEPAKSQTELEAKKRETEKDLESKQETEMDSEIKSESGELGELKPDKSPSKNPKSKSKDAPKSKARTKLQMLMKTLRKKLKKKVKKELKKCVKKVAKQILKELKEEATRNSTAVTDKPPYQKALKKALVKCLKMKNAAANNETDETTGAENNEFDDLPASPTGDKMRQMLLKSIKKAAKMSNAASTVVAFGQSAPLNYFSLILAPHLVYIATVKFHILNAE